MKFARFSIGGVSRAVGVTLFTCLCALWLAGCGTAGSSSSGPPPPPPTVTVSVSPSTASLYFGQQQQFSATVSGTTNTAVTWEVNGQTGGATTLGTITAAGLYTAPDILPSSATLTITAVSQADTSASGASTVTLKSDVQVTISPGSLSLATGATAQFTAQVTGTGTPSTSVNWSLTGASCPAGCGSLQATGNSATYTAPASAPSTLQVQIVASSVADPSKSATAIVTITSPCPAPLTISPATATVATGATQSFTAQVCFSTNQSVTWSLSGAGCSGSGCGTISSTGIDTATYTAPGSVPSVPQVQIVATSAADTTKSASATVTITGSNSCSPPISVSPSSATVPLGQQQSFTAQVCFSTNQAVTWSISGSGCGSANCGTVSSTGVNTATYTAPSSLPPASPISLTATSQADTTMAATASVSVVSAAAVGVSPISAEIAVNRRVSLSASVQQSSNQAVTWAVSGVTNGNATVGRICIAGSNPCAAPSGPAAGAVDYLAPAAVPSPAGVSVTATAAADPAASAAASITILPHLLLELSPANAVVPPSGTVEFAVSVVGSPNAGATWKAACSGSSCGSVGATGVYTAPAAAPSPNSITITAVSQDDPSQSATATVALTSAVALSSLSPSSATAGAADAFTLAVAGYNLAPSSPGPGATLLVNGTARTTTCPGATRCTATIDAADVASPGTILVQARNPDGSLSNSLPFVIVPADGPAAVISLSPAQPISGAQDITAVEPTTDGSGSAPLNIVLLGVINPSTNACNVSLSPVELARPSSGTATDSLCVAGTGLDPSFTYAIAGSQSSDVAVSSPQPFAGSLIEITVTISPSAAPGPRTLLVTSPEKDRAAASGAIDVE